MIRIRAILLLAAVILGPRLALAASGDVCAVADPTHYAKVAVTDECKLLCDGISQGTPNTTCGPIYFSDQKGATDFVCSIEKAQTNCVTSTDIKIQESSSGAAGLPTVWTTVCTLTGVIDPLVQSCSFGRTPKGAVRVLMTALADTDCTDVDVTCTLKKPAPIR